MKFCEIELLTLKKVKFCWYSVLNGCIHVSIVYNVPVAQLDRVSASDAEGRGFESLRVRHKKPSVEDGFFCYDFPDGENPGSFWLVIFYFFFISSKTV